MACIILHSILYDTSRIIHIQSVYIYYYSYGICDRPCEIYILVSFPSTYRYILFLSLINYRKTIACDLKGFTI